MLSKKEFRELSEERKSEECKRLDKLIPCLEKFIDDKLSKGITEIYFSELPTDEYKDNKEYFLEKLKQIYSDGGWKVEFLFERNYTKYESFPNVSYYDTYTGFKFS